MNKYENVMVNVMIKMHFSLPIIQLSEDGLFMSNRKGLTLKMT